MQLNFNKGKATGAGPATRPNTSRFAQVGIRVSHESRSRSLIILSLISHKIKQQPDVPALCSVQNWLVNYLDLVPDVDDERVADGLHGGPLAGAAADLQAADVLVGEEDGEHAGVGVRGETQREVRLRAPRVVVGAQGDAALRAAERPLEVCLVQAQPRGQRPHQQLAQLHHLAPVLLTHLPAARNILL
jgi:hypothetical protein